jgi:hypothetical protein
VARPVQVDLWIGRDVAKEHAAALEALLDRDGQHRTAGLVNDQPGSIAQLTLAVAAPRAQHGELPDAA